MRVLFRVSGAIMTVNARRSAGSIEPRAAAPFIRLPTIVARAAAVAVLIVWRAWFPPESEQRRRARQVEQRSNAECEARRAAEEYFGDLVESRSVRIRRHSGTTSGGRQ